MRKILTILGILIITIPTIVAIVFFINPYWMIEGDYKDAEKVARIATKQKNPSICSKIVSIKISPRGGPFSGDLILSCYARVAQALMDSSICNNIIKHEKSSRDDFSVASRTGCYAWFAVTLNDTSVCNNSNISKDNCYVITAKGLDDESLCDMVARSYFKDSCHEYFSDIKKTREMCEKNKDESLKSFCNRPIIPYRTEFLEI